MTYPYPAPIVLTYNEILEQYGDVLLSSMLVSNTMVLLLLIYITQYTASWNLKSWIEMANIENPTEDDRNELKAKLLRLFGWICLPVALFFSLMIIAYRFGVVL